MSKEHIKHLNVSEKVEFHLTLAECELVHLFYNCHMLTVSPFIKKGNYLVGA